MRETDDAVPPPLDAVYVVLVTVIHQPVPSGLGGSKPPIPDDVKRAAAAANEKEHAEAGTSLCERPHPHRDRQTDRQAGAQVLPLSFCSHVMYYVCSCSRTCWLLVARLGALVI